MTNSKIEPGQKEVTETIQTRLFAEIRDNDSTYPTMEDFLPKGKFAHVFIPQYVYVPQWVLILMLGTTNVRTEDEYILWYRLHQARSQAMEAMCALEGKNHEYEIESNSINTLYSTFLTSKIYKVPQNIIELVQHKHTHQWENKQTKAGKTISEIDTYDMFIRPLEQFFGYNQPLNSKLMHATKDIYMQHWIANRLQQFISLNQEQNLNMSENMLGEISKIRHLQGCYMQLARHSYGHPVDRTSPLSFNGLNEISKDKEDIILPEKDSIRAQKWQAHKHKNS